MTLKSFDILSVEQNNPHIKIYVMWHIKWQHKSPGGIIKALLYTKKLTKWKMQEMVYIVGNALLPCNQWQK